MDHGAQEGSPGTCGGTLECVHIAPFLYGLTTRNARRKISHSHDSTLLSTGLDEAAYVLDSGISSLERLPSHTHLQAMSEASASRAFLSLSLIPSVSRTWTPLPPWFLSATVP